MIFVVHPNNHAVFFRLLQMNLSTVPLAQKKLIFVSLTRIPGR